jgi:hypothetical protein
MTASETPAASCLAAVQAAHGTTVAANLAALDRLPPLDPDATPRSFERLKAQVPR